jgi:hypothetical protein
MVVMIQKTSAGKHALRLLMLVRSKHARLNAKRQLEETMISTNNAHWDAPMLLLSAQINALLTKV